MTDPLVSVKYLLDNTWIQVLCLHFISRLMYKVGTMFILTIQKRTFLYKYTIDLQPHLSPGVSLIYDLAYDSGMIQSELFTSRNQNLVLAKLPNSGFWRYGQFFKWNRVKMAKNGLKMVEIFWGASHMINNNIFNIFCF